MGGIRESSKKKGGVGTPPENDRPTSPKGQTLKEHHTGDLDQRMADAGMTPVSQMLEQNSLGKFSCHAGVTDLEKFEKWIQMRREEFIRMQASMTLDGREDDELFEWVVAHNAVLGEVMANFRQATGR